jgi:hypothetical protein
VFVPSRTIGHLFSAFNNEGGYLDLINLGPDMTSDAPCEHFVNAEVIVTDVSPAFSPFSVRACVCGFTVFARDDTPQLGPGHIALQTFICSETPICQ